MNGLIRSPAVSSLLLLTIVVPSAAIAGEASDAAIPPPPPSAETLEASVSDSADTATPLHTRIDQTVAESHPGFADLAGSICTDTEFVRRVSLDLTGCIPAPDVVRSFLADPAPSSDKRTALIDQLLTTPQHARRLQYVFDEMLMERRGGGNVPDAAWKEYLFQSFRDNKAWDQLVREILAADGADEELRAAAKFYLDRNFDVDLVTRDIGRVFLGVDLECAQCHDHPVINDYLQAHYHGLSAFLRRSYLFTDPKSKQKMLGEKADGEVKFTSVFTGEEGQTDPRVLEMPEIPDPEGMEEAYVVAPEKTVRGVPKYSRRQRLAEVMISAENTAFRRNIVNRLWALMMGRGLVEPLDMRHAENPPTHPQLLELLGEEFAGQDYNIRYLLREIALSQTYQRTSRTTEETAESARDALAVARLKPLSAEQLARSMLQATGTADRLLAAKVAEQIKNDPETGPAQVEQAEWREEALSAAAKPVVDQFAARFAGLGGQKTGFDATASQALFLVNGTQLQSWLAPQGENLVARAAAASDPVATADELYLSILSRPPSEEEAAEVGAYIETVGDPVVAIQEIAWALLSSAEFRFNH